MLYLMTGPNGSGKTAKLLTDILVELKSGRTIFQHGIRGFALPHIYLYCRSDACKICRKRQKREEDLGKTDFLFVDQWPDLVEPGNLFIIDECQYCYPPSPSGSKKSRDLAAFSSHRHDGIDFYIVTPLPKYIHTDLRGLMTWHRHVTANFMSRLIIEFPETRDNPVSHRGGVSSKYTLPKKVFELYDSAEQHNKVKRKIPRQAWMFITVALLLPVLAYKFYSSIQEQRKPKTTAGLLAGSAPATSGAVPASNDASPLTLFDFQPSYENVLESAPAFTGMVEYKDYPRLSMCLIEVESGRCSCYTQQATPYPATKNECYERALGKSFNPYVSAIAKQSDNDRRIVREEEQ